MKTKMKKIQNKFMWDIFPALITGLFFLTAFTNGEIEERPLPFLPAIDKIVADEMTKQELVGVAVGVVKNGRLTHLKGYGHADRDRKITIKTNTPIRWASISKTITAVAALQLVEQGKMKLDDKVSKHLGNDWKHTNNRKDITIRHLLQHRSGINHYGRGMGNKKETKYTNKNKKYSGSTTSYDAKASIARFSQAPLIFNPGTKYRYSSYGYDLLGAVVDRVAPNGYVKWVEVNIKKPLGLGSLKPSYAAWSGYQRTKNGIEKLSSGSKASVLPAGGWMSNVQDLTTYMQALMKGKLLSNSTIMKQKLKNTRYGHGYEVLNKCGATVYGHGGTHGNLRTDMYFYGKTNSTDGIVVMINGSQGENFGSNSGRVKLYNRIAKAIGKSCNISSKIANSECGSSKGGNKMAAIWRKSNDDVVIRRGYNYTGFSKVWSELKTIGYRCIDLETYTRGNVRYWDGIFSQAPTKSKMYRGMSTAKFSQEWKKMSASGFRLVDIETYGSGKNRKWAGIFINGSGKHALFRNYKTNDFFKKKEDLGKKGYKLVDIEAYEEGGVLKWAGVWNSGPNVKFNYNKGHNEFGSLHSDREKKGYRIIDVEPYKYKGKTYWSGIWEKSTKSQKINRNLNYCKILEKNNTWEKQGHEMIDMEIY
jgi:CubicO group peptidase (beta-lactamase class C family)